MEKLKLIRHQLSGLLQEFKNVFNILRAEVSQLDDQPSELGADDIDFATSASQAVLHQEAQGARQAIYFTAIIIFILLVWSAWAKVDEFAPGVGKVIPSQHLQVIQNLEGGILAELYVDEGDEVIRDQPLLRIDDTLFSSNYREQAQQLDQLRIKIARLQAEVDGKTFENYGDLVPKEDSFLDQELNLFVSRRNEMESQASVFREQLSQRLQELEEAQSRIKQLQTSYDLVTEELSLTKPLEKEGAVSKVDILRLERQVNDIAGDLRVARLSEPKLASQVQEYQAKLDGHIYQFRTRSQEELNKALSELELLSESRDALADRVTRTMVRSPVVGRVNRLLVNTIGGVIQPGMDIVEVVPTEESLLIEARVSPIDIAHIYPGQPAVIKITAYDFTIYGGLKGEVLHISPDSLIDDQGNPYFLIRIQTDQNFLGSFGEKLEITPGMTVEAQIHTGQKTILSYLLKPVLRAKNRAFSER